MLVMVLSDDETYSNLEECTIVKVDIVPEKHDLDEVIKEILKSYRSGVGHELGEVVTEFK